MKYDEVETFVKDLRDFADFMEAHGVELPSGYFQAAPTMSLSLYFLNKEPLVQATKVLTKAGSIANPVKKDLNDYSYSVKQKFGKSIELEFWASRDSVCTRKQVGTEKVPKREYVETGEMIEKPVYEWDCDPLLKD